MARRRRRARGSVAAAVAVVVVGWLVLLSTHVVLAWVVFGLVVAGLLAVPVWRELDRRSRRSRRRTSRRNLVPAPREPARPGMTGPEFEEFVAGLLVRDGCEGVEISGGAGDRGADIKAVSPEGHRVIVQCKCYRTTPVGDPDMQRFLGTVRQVHNAAIPLFVTTSRFTAPATRLAREHGIVLVDGPKLDAWTRGRSPVPPDPTEFVGEVTG